jgi:hypothetical protein
MPATRISRGKNASHQWMFRQKVVPAALMCDPCRLTSRLATEDTFPASIFHRRPPNQVPGTPVGGHPDGMEVHCHRAWEAPWECWYILRWQGHLNSPTLPRIDRYSHRYSHGR